MKVLVAVLVAAPKVAVIVAPEPSLNVRVSPVASLAMPAALTVTLAWVEAVPAAATVGPSSKTWWSQRDGDAAGDVGVVHRALGSLLRLGRDRLRRLDKARERGDASVGGLQGLNALADRVEQAS